MANYPSSIASFATHTDNTDTVFAADVNTPNAEIVAIETALLNGFQHDIVPLADGGQGLGNASHRWLKLFAETIDISGATAGQIAFPSTQNPSSNANTLDDYSEGTWTPALSSASGSGITYTTQTGVYVKIGRMVFATFAIIVSGLGTASGALTLTGLPYTVENVGASTLWNGQQCDWASFTNAQIRVGIDPVVNTTTATFLAAAAATTNDFSALNVADISATAQLRGTVMYRAVN